MNDLRIRPYNPKKWDEGYIRAFGIKCKKCKGTGWLPEHDPELGALQGVEYRCPECNGLGKIERKKK